MIPHDSLSGNRGPDQCHQPSRNARDIPQVAHQHLYARHLAPDDGTAGAPASRQACHYEQFCRSRKMGASGLRNSCATMQKTRPLVGRPPSTSAPSFCGRRCRGGAMRSRLRRSRRRAFPPIVIDVDYLWRYCHVGAPPLYVTPAHRFGSETQVVTPDDRVAKARNAHPFRVYDDHPLREKKPAVKTGNPSRWGTREGDAFVLAEHCRKARFISASGRHAFASHALTSVCFARCGTARAEWRRTCSITRALEVGLLCRTDQQAALSAARPTSAHWAIAWRASFDLASWQR